MNPNRLLGLVAATYTPFDRHGRLALDVVPKLVDHLLACGVSGLYVCGSTGEGMSLSTIERQATAKAYVDASRGRVPVIVQVGHNSLVEARALAEHAQSIGADVVSATCPSYFKTDSVDGLAQCMAEVAGGAPDLPFYYYHIPALTGSSIEIIEFMELGYERIPNLAGLKYTDTKLYEFQACIETTGNRGEVVWGCDEMLLGALATGAKSAIGSTYNVAATLYCQIMTAMQQGNLDEARSLQSLSVKLVRTLNRFPFHSAMKAVLAMRGFEMGSCRLPQASLSSNDVSKLRSDLDAIGFFDWSEPSQVHGDSDRDGA